MQNDGYFDQRVAATYDDDIGELAKSEAVDPVVNFLVDLAGAGPALEFGIGTGRVALPLQERGVPVHGLELSRAMANKLREKLNGDDLPVTIGDFASKSTGKTYSLVYLLFNTIMHLETQASQVSCFRNAAAHLDPGGYFVVEVMIPRLRSLSKGENCHVFQFGQKNWGIDEYELSTQRIVSHHLKFRSGEIERISIPFRYVWPTELDLMAQLAGMTLTGRWADWDGKEFTDESSKHISVWTKTA